MAIGRVDGRIERASAGLMGIEASRLALRSSRLALASIANQLDAIGPNAVLPSPPPLAAVAQRC